MAAHSATGQSELLFDMWPIARSNTFPVPITVGGNTDTAFPIKPSDWFFLYREQTEELDEDGNPIEIIWRYLVVANWLDNALQIMRSTDGRQWEEVGNPSPIVFHTGFGSGGYEFTVWAGDVRDGINDNILITYLHETEEKTRVRIFNVATLTWGSEITAGPDNTATQIQVGGSYADRFCVRRSDDVYICIYSDNNGSGYRRLYWNRWDSGGGWGTPEEISVWRTGATNISIGLVALWMDRNTDRIYMMCQDGYGHFYTRSLNSADELSNTEWVAYSGWYPTDAAGSVGKIDTRDGKLFYGHSSFDDDYNNYRNPAIAWAIPGEPQPEWAKHVVETFPKMDTTAITSMIEKAAGGWWAIWPSGGVESAKITRVRMTPITPSGVGSDSDPMFSIYDLITTMVSRNWIDADGKRMIGCAFMNDADYSAYYYEQEITAEDDSPLCGGAGGPLIY